MSEKEFSCALSCETPSDCFFIPVAQGLSDAAGGLNLESALEPSPSMERARTLMDRETAVFAVHGLLKTFCGSYKEVTEKNTKPH